MYVHLLKRKPYSLLIYAFLTIFILVSVSDYTAPKRMINLLKPTGYVMHQQVQQPRILHSATLYLCIL